MNNSKEQTVKQERSAEEIKSLIYEGVTKHAGKHGSVSCRSIAIISMGKYAKPFQQRIAELEAELKRKDEALYEIKKLDDWGDYRQIARECVRIAEQAIKPKSDDLHR